MPKAYLVTAYRSISDHDKLAAYARLSKPAIELHGGTILARGNVARTFEGGLDLRMVIVEFDGVEAAAAAFESPEYRHATDVLGDGAERDVRIIEGVA